MEKNKYSKNSGKVYWGKKQPFFNALKYLKITTIFSDSKNKYSNEQRFLSEIEDFYLLNYSDNDDETTNQSFSIDFVILILIIQI